MINIPSKILKLMQSAAYRNAAHPDYAATQNAVANYFAETYGTGAYENPNNGPRQIRVSAHTRQTDNGPVEVAEHYRTIEGSSSGNNQDRPNLLQKMQEMNEMKMRGKAGAVVGAVAAPVKAGITAGGLTLAARAAGKYGGGTNLVSRALQRGVTPVNISREASIGAVSGTATSQVNTGHWATDLAADIAAGRIIRGAASLARRVKR